MYNKLNLFVNKFTVISSNINEVIRAVLNSLFFFFFFCKKILHAPKAQKSTKTSKKYKKRKNATKQKHKTQISEQKLKMRLKNI